MIKRIILAALFVLAFNAFAIVVLLFLPPALGFVWAIAVGAAFLWWHFRKSPRRVERQALLRMDRPAAPMRWVLLAGGATLLVAFGISGFIELYAPPLTEVNLQFWEMLTEYQSSVSGWIAVAILFALVVPLVEEFCFRGHIQHTLEKRVAPVWAILITATLFSAMHIGVPHWSIHTISFAFGLGAGAAAFFFRSIWVAVGIHMSWNGSMMVLSLIHADTMATFGGMPEGLLLPLSILLLVTGLASWYVVLAQGDRGTPMDEGGEGVVRVPAGEMPMRSGVGEPASYVREDGDLDAGRTVG